MKGFNEKFGYAVAEVKAVVDIKVLNRDIKKGDIVTVSNLNHPTDVKLWASGSYQAKPNWFDLSNPVHIIRKVKIVLILLIALFGCRVQSPYKRGFVLTPEGYALKDTLTTSEKKMYYKWRKEEEQKLKTNEVL